jgi:hypothetical protein
LSCGLRETSSVDYTDFEEARLREKRKMFQITHYITGPPQREEIFFREIKNETVIKFYFRSMPQLKFLRTFFISFVVFVAAVYRPSSMVDYTKRRKTERKKFLYVSN